MPWGAIAGAAISAGASYLGSKKQNEASAEAAEAARDLPEWLKPFYIGGGPYPDQEPVPVNYNWLDAMNGVAQSGMPSSGIPPMNMNNPMMTFQNVHTPTEGGPWGYGLSPGQLTTEAGIPSASAGPPPTPIPLGPGMGGPQMGGVGPGAGAGAGPGAGMGQGPAFVPAPPGFTPGPQTPAPAPDAAAGGGGFTDEMMERARQYQAMSNYGGMGGGRLTGNSATGALEALDWARRNEGASDEDMRRRALRNSINNRQYITGN